ncbi:MAG: hypothetical protein Q7S50_04250 [bacterium]|nr:hypothetical protein [bacterium]
MTTHVVTGVTTICAMRWRRVTIRAMRFRVTALCAMRWRYVTAVDVAVLVGVDGAAITRFALAEHFVLVGA